MTAYKHRIRKVTGPLIASLSIILACVALSWSESSLKEIAPEKVVAVIHCNYAPITFWDNNTGKPSGFGVDIINSVAKRAGLEVSYICKPGWPEMITSIETGEATISVLLKSEEREKILLFSSPVDITYLSYFARSESMINPDIVPLGYIVGVIKGSRTYEHLQKQGVPNLSVEGTYQEGIFGLLAGKIDLFAGEESMIQKHVRETGLEDRIKKIGKPFSEQERCLIVRKDNVQLQKRLNNALQGFIGSSEYQQIYTKWYKEPAPYWTTNKILAASGLLLFIAISGMAYWRYLSILKINRELVHSINERKRTEKSLRESEDKFRSIFEQAIDGIMIADAETKRQLEANKAICGMLGYARDEILSLNVDDVHPKKDLPAIRSLFEKQLRGEISLIADAPMLRRDGTVFYADINSTPVTLGGIQCLVGIFRDVTERKKTEELIKQNEIFIKSILESVDEGFVIVGRDYRIISANKAFCDRAGMTIENAIGRYCYEVSHHSTVPCFEAGEQCSVKRTFETGEHDESLHTHYDEQGNPQYVDTKSYAMRDAAGIVTSAIEICIDITEKKKMEDQYRQVQKMEAIGQLAGGVAHDFNNILSAIIGYGHLSLMKLREDDPIRHYIDQILQSSERAATLTQSLLAFGRKQPTKKELHELNAVIRNFEKFLHRLLREDIEMTIQYTAEQPVVMADRGQVEQVIMNLVTNARDAMPDKGKLTIGTIVSAMDESFMRFHGYGKVGDYAVLSVSDTGIGMNEETKKRIFEPFFTTKEVGKGTGLGLATVYGIVKAHEGFINVYSEPGKGSTFHVYFPLAHASNAVTEPAGHNPVVRKGGSETILLAEDDAILRNMTSVVLRDMGYTVIEAEDGNKAVIRFSENSTAIKLVILDGIMPRMNGLEAYREINALNPNIRCIFMSGYSGEVFARDGMPTGTMFMPKPVKPSKLLSEVREMLDRE
jgi:two-component system, cell cycle sensor histidine kinase and response regulator CckA